MNVGEVIVNLRKQKGVEQQEFAKSLGKSIPYISLIENNKKRPSVPLLAQIAAYFDIPVATLIFKAIEKTAAKNQKQKAFFEAATPIVNKLINYLLSEEDTPREKDSLARNKHS